MLIECFGIGLAQLVFLCLRVLNSSSFPPALEKDEEEALFGKMKEGDENARQMLIEHNLRLVAHIIKKYDSDREEQEDLISVGTIGLIKAIDSFRPTLGNRFATYAGKCIQNEILMYFRSQKKYSVETSLGEAIEVDKDGNPLTIFDVMRVEDNIVEEIALKGQTGLALTAVRTILDDRERLVISKRFGLDGKKCATQREIAAEMGISRSYVSRIEKGALEKLRSFMEKPRNYI
ncbi:MAG: sigma-70 family RNA polymerase sigma factor [Ruminococcaceae bacterium]|nr:sigma-70 family RNA polymerase sigma factor [Oscillospiraceae bacterium]